MYYFHPELWVKMSENYFNIPERDKNIRNVGEAKVENVSKWLCPSKKCQSGLGSVRVDHVVFPRGSIVINPKHSNFRLFDHMKRTIFRFESGF